MIRIFTFLLIPYSLYCTDPAPKNKLSGNFDLGMNYTKNIESTFQLNNLFLLKYQKKKSSFSIKNNIALINKSGEDEILNKGTQDFKYSLNSKKLSLNFTLNHTYDISRSIKNRYSSGIGFSYNIKDENNKKLDVGLSAIREKEINLFDESKLQNRISSNLDFTIKNNKKFSIVSSNLYQPNIEETSDFRFKTSISFRIILNNYFLISLNNTYNYDSRPEESVNNSDFQMINSVSYTF
ncbi:MAG: hypothetical protein CMD02_00225 [Flavobacteriales bacterium]|nr:hypothetical protein [Flavobacteriales bacterium]